MWADSQSGEISSKTTEAPTHDGSRWNPDKTLLGRSHSSRFEALRLNLEGLFVPVVAPPLLVLHTVQNGDIAFT